jgi:hypothetical protein
MRISTRTILSLALFGALAATASLAQAQQVSARVISSTPMRDAHGPIGYSVTYEYAGQQYTTRMDSPPGPTIALQLSPMGVTTSPVPDQPQQPYADNGQPQQWDNVVAQPGVVVGTGAGPGGPYGAPGYPVAAPGYPVAAPVYVQPGYGYGYGYAAPWPVVAPIGLSLNLGYAHGWGGGGWHRWH